MKNTILLTAALTFLFLNTFAVDDWNWVRSGSSSAGSDVAVDASGNVYVVGIFDGSATFGSTTITSAGNSDVFLAKYDNAGTLLWIKNAGGTGEDGDDNGTSLALDNSGNAVIYGTFGSSAITFGSTTLTNASAGTMDAFVAKYDPAGNVLWAKRFGGTNDDGRQPGSTTIGRMEIDASGNLYFAGAFMSATLTFGSTTLTNSGNLDGYVVKLDNSGNVMWAAQQGSAGGDASYSVALDNSSGMVYVSGFFSAPLFGMPGASGQGQFHGFLLKYNTSGVLQWARKQGGTTNIAQSVAIDGSGNPYIAGYFRDNSLTVGSFTLANGIAGNYDSWVAKYDASGNALWAKSFGGGTGIEWTDGKGLAFTSGGTLWLEFFSSSTTITVGSSTFTNASRDFYLAKLDPATGNVVSVNQYGSSGDEYAFSLFIDNSDRLYVTGEFNSPTLTLGPHSLVKSGGGFNMFVGGYGLPLCAPAGTACDDGNAATSGDVEDGSCGCAGTPTNIPTLS